jgi:hypothetical protein
MRLRKTGESNEGKINWAEDEKGASRQANTDQLRLLQLDGRLPSSGSGVRSGGID